MNSKIPVNATIDPGSLSIPASPIFQKEKNTYAHWWRSIVSREQGDYLQNSNKSQTRV